MSSSTKSVYERLFTHEDILNVHKTLGVLSILSFCARLPYLLDVKHDMGFASYPKYTPLTVLVHWGLVMSSLVFKIPEKRIKQGNRLWPQARLHNICFITRHLALVLLYWAEYAYGWEPNFYWNYAILMLNLLSADYVTNSAKHKSNTIRDLEAHPAAKYFFSMAQFGPSTFCLLGLRRSSGHFFIVFVIQLTAFLTTLKRKHIMNHEFGVFLYGLEIVMGILVNMRDLMSVGGMQSFHIFSIVSRGVFLLRIGGPDWMGPLKNKYVLWTMAAVFLHYTRPFGPEVQPFALWLQEEAQSKYLAYLSAIVTAATVWYGYIITQRQLPAFREVQEKNKKLN